MTSERRRLEAAAPELSAELRRLRELNRLTLAALAKRTNYSKSSWERYLNGKVIPPESAVVAFAQTVGVRPDELLMLRNRAERAERAEREQTGDAPVRGPAAAGSGGRVTTGPDRAAGGEVAPERGRQGGGRGHAAGTPGRRARPRAGLPPGHRPRRRVGPRVGPGAGTRGRGSR
ncbi:helix-turn-helix transcriptional regulator [Streptomyces sp. S6]|nr:helix-turn-helix transcriptional regulator [Streptomyces sp. S6]